MIPVLIGQPTVTQFLITIQVVCSCEKKPALLAVGGLGLIFGCGLCGQGYQVAGFQSNPVTGQVDVQLHLVKLPNAKDVS